MLMRPSTTGLGRICFYWWPEPPRKKNTLYVTNAYIVRFNYRTHHKRWQKTL